MHSLWIVALMAAAAHSADVDQFEPSGSAAHAEGSLQGESASLGSEGPAVGISAGYARDPLVQRHPEGHTEPAVRQLLPMSLYGGYTFGSRGRIEAFLPFYAHVDAPWTGHNGPALGDLRLQANLPVYADPNSASSLHLSLLPRLRLPTGQEDALVRGGLSGGLTLAVSGRLEQFGWLANAGFSATRPSDVGTVPLGHSADLLAGGWWHATEQLRVGAEVDLRASLVPAANSRSISSTGHLFAQNTWDQGIGVLFGFGGGLLGGIGAPRYRFFAALTWAPGASDRDGDGISDRLDQCPDEPEDFDGWQDEDGCPDLDNDGDGIGDFMDQCPNEPEDLDGWEDHDGCPDPDNDGDGILDVDDACPDEAGPAETGGCPDRDGDGVADHEDLCPDQAGPIASMGCPDRDEDGVPDYRDACPDDAKPATEDADRSDGCPKAAWLAGNHIGLGGAITFSGGDIPGVTAESVPTLQAVARLMREYPQILQIQITAHTDNQLPEDEASAQTLAQAEAVARWLVRRGISRDRMVTVGEGLSSPIDTNRTASGQARNRRVEIPILRQEAIDRPAHPAPPQVARIEAPPIAPARPAPTPSAVQVPSHIDPHGEAGRLSVVIADGGWANVYLNGARLTRGAPFTGLQVAAGVHELSIRNPQTGLLHERVITVENGRPVKVVVGGSVATSEPSVHPEPVEPETPAERVEPEAPAEAKERKTPSVFDGNFPLFAEEREAQGRDKP